MPGTKLLALACAVSLCACVSVASDTEQPQQPGTAGGFSSLTPEQRMPISAATNDWIVARGHTLDAHDAYERVAEKLAAARRRKAPSEQIRALASQTEELRARLRYRRALQREKHVALLLVRARLAQTYKLTGFGSVKHLTREHAAAEKAENVAKRGIDMRRAQEVVADAWPLIAATSHNQASRMRQGVELFEAMAAAVAGAKSKCTLMARGLRSVYRRHAIVVSRLRDGRSGSGKVAKPLERQFQPRAEAAIRKIRTGVIPCLKDPDVVYQLRRVRPRGATLHFTM